MSTTEYIHPHIGVFKVNVPHPVPCPLAGIGRLTQGHDLHLFLPHFNIWRNIGTCSDYDQAKATHWLIVPPLPIPEPVSPDLAAAEAAVSAYDKLAPNGTRWSKENAINVYQLGLRDGRKQASHTTTESKEFVRVNSCPTCCRNLAPIRLHGFDTFYCPRCLPERLRGIESALLQLNSDSR